MEDNAGGGGGGGGGERAKYLGFNTIAPHPSPDAAAGANDESEKEMSFAAAGSPKHFKKPSTTTTASIEAFNIETLEVGDDHDIEKNGVVERSKWVLDAPPPPGVFREVVHSVRDSISSLKKKYYSSPPEGQSFTKRLLSVHQDIFPILVWGRNYRATKFKNDLMAGLTIASLCIPQVI